MKHIYTFKQFIQKPLLVAFALLAMSSNAWGKAGDITFYASVEASPASGGTVSLSPGTSQTKNSPYKSWKYQETSATFTYSATANVGYTFKGWSTNSSANSGNTTNPMSQTYKGTGNLLGTATKTADKYYAIFATMTADKSSIAFGSILKGVESDAVTVTVSHAHAGSITAALSGSHPGDFILSKTSIATSTTAGTATFTVKFKPSATGNRSASLTISSNNGLSEITITLSGTGMATVNPEYTCAIANTYYVEDASLNLNTLWTSTSPATKAYSIKNFTPSGSNNTGATAPKISGTTLSLGQAGTLTILLTQAATTGYYAGEAEKTITISKRPNSLNCSWGSWSKTLNVDSEVGVTFSSNNASTPFDVDITEGNTIAEYNNDKIKSNCNLGVAKWTVTQAENYKYVAPTAKTLTVTVEKASDPGCEISLYEAAAEATASNVGEIDLGGVGVTLYFYIKYNGLGGTATLSTYNSQTQQWSDQSVSASVGGYKQRTINLGANVTKIKFGKGGGIMGTDDPYIKEIKVTRQKYFNLQDAKKAAISTLEMTNYIGGNTTSATFFVDYSTCASVVKIASNNDHITVSPTSFNTDGKAGRKEITVTYASDEAEEINAVITAYTPYENKRLEVRAETKKKPQELTWSDTFEGEAVSLPITFACNDAATASTNLPVTYSTGNDQIIKISDDMLSFTIIGAGTTTLTATQAGNDEWQTVSETKTITATNKKIQFIAWAQNMNRAASTDDEIPLEAKVKIYTNIATGELEESEERTAYIKYSCPANNGVIQITDAKKIRVIGYGTTTITAQVDGNDEYEAAIPVTMPVRIREKRTGDCEASLAFEQSEEIEFYQASTSLNTLTLPQISHTIEISNPAGVPESLTFDVRGEAYIIPGVNREVFGGDIEVYESTDGGVTWSSKKATVTGVKNDIASSNPISISPNITNLKFVRPQGGTGHHYVGNIQITSKPFIRTAKTTINLGNIALGAVKRQNINIEYSSVKGNLTVAQNVSGSAGLTVENQIDVECGTVVTYPLEVAVTPTAAGPWSNTITIADPKQPNLTLQITLTATGTKGSQAIVWNPNLNITTIEAPALNAYATSGLDVTYEVTDGDDVAAIVNGQVEIAKPGTFTITVTQDGDNDYNAAEALVKTFTVSKATPSLEWANAPQELACNASGTVYRAESSSNEGAITYAITSGGDYATINATTGALTILVPGQNITVQASQAESVKFNAPEPITIDVTITEAPEVNTFTNNAGDNEWNNPENWESGFVPVGENPNVVINGGLNVEGNDPISVGGLTIKTGMTVTIKDGATLVVNDDSQTREAYGNIVVEAGGKLIVETGELSVNDLTLYAVASGYVDAEGQEFVPGKSGQVNNETNIQLHGKAYFVLDIDPRDEATEGWYDFTVPFPVNASTGLSRKEGDEWLPMTYNSDYAIMTYNENLRSQGKSGWQKFSQIMQPCTGYTFATAHSTDTYRFEKTADGAFYGSNEKVLTVTEDGQERLKGWNGLGNGTMSYVTLPDAPLNTVQMFDHVANIYRAVDASSQFVVGSAYFVQAATNGSTLIMEAVTSGSRATYHAPARSSQRSTGAMITVSHKNIQTEADRLYITADEDATSSYTIGKDLAKMGATNSTGITRIWSSAKDAKLCAVYAYMSGNEVVTPINLFLPGDGSYMLSAKNIQADKVYLLRNGIIVWDLAKSDYIVDLSAGTNTEYSIKLVNDVWNTTTGVDDVTSESSKGIDVQKMILDGNLYMLRDGILYDAQGKVVSNAK